MILKLLSPSDPRQLIHIWHYIWQSSWHILWHSFWHIYSDIPSGILPGILIGVCVIYTLWHSTEAAGGSRDPHLVEKYESSNEYSNSLKVPIYHYISPLIMYHGWSIHQFSSVSHCFSQGFPSISGTSSEVLCSSAASARGWLGTSNITENAIPPMIFICVYSKHKTYIETLETWKIW